jgi:hypothetical protein
VHESTSRNFVAELQRSICPGNFALKRLNPHRQRDNARECNEWNHIGRNVDENIAREDERSDVSDISQI